MLLLLVATTTNGCTVVSSQILRCWFRIHAEVSTQMPKLATVESHTCILLLSFHSACYLSNSGGFHAIKATKGRSLGGVAYIYIYACIYVYASIYMDLHMYIYMDIDRLDG